MGGTSKTTANTLKKEIRDPAAPELTITTLYEQFDAFGNPGKATGKGTHSAV
ncbi:MAG: hypothetical protein K9J06_14390 [Flavobacteriales bacterium]|nr:hypothetical protein [Flavobacteriales bacterium]